MSQTLLLTGAAGFLGRYVFRAFAEAGWRVIGLDAVPLENHGLDECHRIQLPSTALDELLARTAPDACVHCAGRASVALSMTDPASDFRDSTVMTFELLDALRRHAPRCRVLLLSSAAVYGNPASLPVTEDHACAPLSPYGYHKRQCELLGEEFARIYGLQTAAVRIFSAYGTGLRRQVVWDICAKALANPALQLRGTGAESRDFIHATDIARALLLLSGSAAFTGEIYNLASGEETTVAELAARLLHLLGREVPVAFDGIQTPGDPLRWQASIARIRALGFAPQMPLEDGLRSVAAWCASEHGGTAR